MRWKPSATAASSPMALKMRKQALLRQVQAALDGRIKKFSGA
jgi:hypothetical protein